MHLWKIGTDHLKEILHRMYKHLSTQYWSYHQQDMPFNSIWHGNICVCKCVNCTYNHSCYLLDKHSEEWISIFNWSSWTAVPQGSKNQHNLCVYCLSRADTYLYNNDHCIRPYCGIRLISKRLHCWWGPWRSSQKDFILPRYVSFTTELKGKCNV